jgi:hypothetical protein
MQVLTFYVLKKIVQDTTRLLFRYATLHKSIDIAFPPVQCDSSDEVLEQLVLSNKRINKNVFYGFTQSRLTVVIIELCKTKVVYST